MLFMNQSNSLVCEKLNISKIATFRYKRLKVQKITFFFWKYLSKYSKINCQPVLLLITLHEKLTEDKMYMIISTLIIILFGAA